MKLTRFGLNPHEIAARESLFHVANGYLGVRGCPEEGVATNVRSIRGTYLNAFYETYPIFYAEKLYGFPEEAQTIVNVIDAQGVAVVLAGERFDPFAGLLSHYEQTLDMAAGQYIRRAVWHSPEGRETELVFRRTASFAARELFILEATAIPKNWSGSIEFVSTQRSDVWNDADPNDPRKAAEKKAMLRPVESGIEDGCAYMLCETLRSGLSVACAVTHTCAGLDAAYDTSLSCNTVTLRGEAEQGIPVTVTKWCVYTDSRRHISSLQAAMAMARRHSETPAELWYERQKAILAAFWENARVTFEEPTPLQEGADFAAYALFQSAGQDGVSSIAAKGLSGEGYEGHYFWDTEIYMFPFFLLTQPEMARKLLDYRYLTLDAARRHARLMGHENGALYPWRTIAGSECSTYYPSGSAQYHINSDIAHAVITYYFATGDLIYIRERGLEILIETARLWMDTGHWLNGQFRIDGVTGPDEYTCLVNNNYYTNLSAQYHLRGVLLLCARLAEADPSFSPEARFGLASDEMRAFFEAADHMYLPYDESLGIYAQDDSFLKKKKMDIASMPRDRFPLLMHYHPLAFYRQQVCKQADAVLAHFLYENGIGEDVIRRTYAYYETITTHDSSLSPCVFSMMAARIGEPEKALRYYLQSVRVDLEDTQGNTDDGIHAANMGGIYMGIVYGFAGLRIGSNNLTLRPCLPDSVPGYAFSILYRGRRLRVEVSRGEVVLHADGPEPVSVSVYGRPYRITGRPVVLALQTRPAD